MDRLKTTLITAFVIAILFTPTASAQPSVAAKVEVVSGNGQMICPTCVGSTFTFFYPMVVKVTDASGNPIAGKTVNWQLVSSIGTLPSFDTVTFTDSNGLSAATLIGPGVQTASIFINFLQSVISATVDGATVNFTETQALTILNGTGVSSYQTTLVTPFWNGADGACRQHRHRSHPGSR